MTIDDHIYAIWSKVKVLLTSFLPEIFLVTLFDTFDLFKWMWVILYQLPLYMSVVIHNSQYFYRSVHYIISKRCSGQQLVVHEVALNFICVLKFWYVYWHLKIVSFQILHYHWVHIATVKHVAFFSWRRNTIRIRISSSILTMKLHQYH